MNNEAVKQLAPRQGVVLSVNLSGKPTNLTKAIRLSISLNAYSVRNDALVFPILRDSFEYLDFWM